MNTPDRERRIFTVNEYDIALTLAQHRNRNTTVGEALTAWDALPSETRTRIIERFQNTATKMFDLEPIIEEAVRSWHRKQAGLNKTRDSNIPGLIFGGGGSLAINWSAESGGEYVPYSPRNKNQFAEGPWENWVTLAETILQLNEEAEA